MALPFMAPRDWEGWELEVKLKYLKSDVEKELCIKPPDRNRES